MKPLEEMSGMNLEQLQEQKNLRDAEVQRLRAEMAQIHAIMEPLWAEQLRLTAGPANLKQVLGDR